MIAYKSKLKELIKAKGAKRVSEEAVEELAKFLEKIAEKVAEEAIKNAQHAKRETVKAEDVKLAEERVC
jgi:histone H3/H4